MDPHIFSPGTASPVPPKTDTKVPGGLFFEQGESVLAAKPIYAAKGQHAQDVLVGNKQHAPWAITIPYLLGRTDVVLKHNIVFALGGRPADVQGFALKMWDTHVCKQNYGEYADSTGQVNAERLDASDYTKVWLEACKLWRKDAQRYRLVAFGDKTYPFFFCIPGELMGFKSLCSTRVDNQLDMRRDW